MTISDIEELKPLVHSTKESLNLAALKATTENAKHRSEKKCTKSTSKSQENSRVPQGRLIYIRPHNLKQGGFSDNSAACDALITHSCVNCICISVHVFTIAGLRL